MYIMNKNFQLDSTDFYTLTNYEKRNEGQNIKIGINLSQTRQQLKSPSLCFFLLMPISNNLSGFIEIITFFPIWCRLFGE